MPSLTSLPRDVHQHIISYLLSVRDVASLSKTCKALHHMCDMELRHEYHSVKIEGNRGSLNIAYDLLIGILRRPVLGHYIRHVEVRAREPRRLAYKEQEPQREIDEEELNLLRGAIRNAGFEGEEEGPMLNMLAQRMSYEHFKFGTVLQRRNMDTVFVPQALAALIVSVAPFLESLSTSPTGCHVYTRPGAAPPPRALYPLDNLLRRVNSNPENPFPYLQNLRKVYIINNPDGIYQDNRFYISMDLFTCITAIDNLPSIESIATDVIEEDGNGLSSLPRFSSQLTTLAIHHSSIPSSYLVSLICSCKTLRNLGFSVGGRCTNSGGHPMFNPKPVLQALLYHKTTLENLDLDVDSYIFAFDPHVDEENELHTTERYDRDYDDTDAGSPQLSPPTLRTQSGSLHSFSNLRHLSIGVGLLFYFARGVTPGTPTPPLHSGFSLLATLPPNLESLCIRGYKRGDVPARDVAIEELVEAIKAGGVELELSGVVETVPRGENVDDPDGQPHLLWRPREEGASEGETDDEE
ncbi:hypothetical protein BJX64DRAFT_271426 [Aspergillus heterothallicus]